MTNIIRLDDHLGPSTKAESGFDASHEEFLLDEGLEVLAAYRSISDKALRLSLKALIENLAAVSDPSTP